MSNSHKTISLPERVREGRRFWASKPGEALWRAERACLGPACEALHGVHSLELSLAPSLTDMCPVRHALRWAPTRELAEGPATLVCQPDRLPLPDGCLQLVVIHHLLEVVADPHHLLQEAARVTADGGRLVLIGWLPLGPAGVARLWSRHRRRWPWSGSWRGPGRLKDWLTFVDFETERIDYCGFHLPGAVPRNASLEALGRRHNLPLGDSFMIRARRRAMPAQVQRPRFSLDAALGGHSLGSATRLTRQSRSDRKIEVD